MHSVKEESINLVVTSPPYPMISMWDEVFCKQNPDIKYELKDANGFEAFELMHEILDAVWKEIWRVLKPGGFACINIGDATRTLGSNFILYPNHMRILKYLIAIGFSPLPDILWRKQTNAPNKFMGSGMLPAGAYVTLEHEYILIVRKGGKREFIEAQEKQTRRESAIFWEERNIFFSDIWMDIKGTTQELASKKTRKRSAAFPFEIASRLINMYSVRGDTVLDPFMGTGTSMAAAMASGRNSVGIEIDESLKDTVLGYKKDIIFTANEYIENRLRRHIQFVKDRHRKKTSMKHRNIHYGFPVVTAQEKELLLNELTAVKEIDKNLVEITYATDPQKSFCRKAAI
ncbi:MAG: site-specific DNA-methyltransferase [Desulfobacterales bacterium]|nr:site-specific DNA-methyltransferase [Desulfobacterales bacterium]